MMFRRGGATRTRDLGRVAIGLGLMLLALHQLLDLVTPFEDVPSLRLLLGAIATEPVLDVLLAAALTWAAHSSVAVVLLVMSLAAKGVVPPDAAFALVLGANLGTAINPVLEGAAGDGRRRRRLPVGNLLNRAGRLRARRWPCSTWSAAGWSTVEPDPARAVADFHTGFNLVLALLFLPLLRPFAALLRALAAGPGRRRRPVAAALSRPGRAGDPAVALAGAAREALRHGRRAGGDAARRLRTRWTATTASGSPRPAAGRRARPAEHRDQGLSERRSTPTP